MINIRKLEAELWESADLNYRNLLRNEYRIIKTLRKKALKIPRLYIPIKFTMGAKPAFAKDAMISFSWKKRQKNIE